MSAAPVPGVDPQVHAACEAFRRDYRAVQAEIGKAIVGHEEIVDGVLTCLFVGGATNKAVPAPPKNVQPKGLPKAAGEHLGGLMAAKKRAQQQIRDKETGE